MNDYPGALIFAGTGPGRQGVRSLIPGYYGSVSPRLGLAYSPNPKTVIRAGSPGPSAALRWCNPPVTTRDPSASMPCFSESGITPAYNWDRVPLFSVAPADQSSVPEQWKRGLVERAECSITRRRTITGRSPCSANPAPSDDGSGLQRPVGSHLNAILMNINQVPMSVVNGADLQVRGDASDQPADSSITSATAVAAGFIPPYANFTTPRCSAPTVSQALRAFPQYLTVDAASGGGDKTGHSAYHAAVLKLNRRMSSFGVSG